MVKSVDGLLDILIKECGLYGDLYDLSRKKSEIIVDGDVDALTRVLSVEQQLVIELGHLENQREKVIEEWALSVGVDPQRATLSEIIPFLNGDTKGRIEKVWNELSEMVSQLRQTNDLNGTLIKNNLEYIDFSIKLLAGQDEAGTVYSKGGKTPVKQQNRNLFDRKA